MQSIQIWKICLLICMKYFVFWVFTNSILFTSYSTIFYNDYLNERKEYFEKIFNWSSYLGFTSSNILPAYFLKHPCKQCSSPLDISSISLETCYIFSQFKIIIFNPAFLLPIFNSMLITRHNIMTCNLELLVIAIKCFDFNMPGVDKLHTCVHYVHKIINFTNCYTWLFSNKYNHKHNFSVSWVLKQS